MYNNEREAYVNNSGNPNDLRSQLDILLERLRDNPENTSLGDLALEFANRLSDTNAAMDILEVMAQCQSDVSTWLKAGMFCCHFGEIGRAVECYDNALRLDPNDKNALYLAALAATGFGRFGLAVKYFERYLGGFSPRTLPLAQLAVYTHACVKSNIAGRRAGEIIREFAPYLLADQGTLRSLINTAAQSCEHRLVHELNLCYIQHWPATDISPADWVVWVRAVKHLENTADLACVADAALEALDGKIATKTLPPHYTLPDIYMARARILSLAGRDFRPALDQCLSHSGYSRNLACLASSEPMAERVYRSNFERWQERFKGTDVLLLANGPSLHTLEPHIDAIRSVQTLRFVVFNEFTSVIRKLLTPIGRNADAISMLASEGLEGQEDTLIDLMGSAARPFLISMPTLIKAQRRSKELLGFSSQLMLANSHLCLSPTPGNGLSFELINSLSLVLPLLLTAEPRRIFLFGADGGHHSSDERVHFDDRCSAGTGRDTTVQDTYLNLLRAEAAMTDEVLAFELPVAAEVYGVNVPKIYNVCPTSNIQLFEKIDIETAVSILNRTN